MRLGEAAALFVLCFASVFCASVSAVDENVEAELRSDYLGKVLTLRHFYKGEHLSFAQDCSLIGTGDVGPWTVYGQVMVGSIELHPHSVQIRGRRVTLIVDSQVFGPRDVLEYLEGASKTQDPSKKKKGGDKPETSGWDKLEDHYRNQLVEIQIALPSESPDVQEVSAAMGGVFVKPGESLADALPDFWRDYMDRIEGRPPHTPQSTETVYRVERGVVSPPRPTYSPQPEFSEEDRKAGYHGTETLTLVVDASGRATEVQVLSPLGLGLDENAVDAVRKWKFEPAQKEGKAVPVKIAIEIDFHN